MTKLFSDNRRRFLLSACAGVLLAGMIGCSGAQNRDPKTLSGVSLPENWQQTVAVNDTATPDPKTGEGDNPGGDKPHPLQTNKLTRWVADFNDPGLMLLLDRVLVQNPGLAAEAARVEQAGAGQVQADAALYPTLDLTGSLTRRQTGDRQSDDSSVSLKAGFELDLWGRLSAREREASMNFASARAGFSAAALDLSAETAIGWFNLVTQKQLLKLYQRREDTLQNALKVVEQGYRNGIRSAADLQQAERNLQQEQAGVAAQQQVLKEQIRRLQLLLGHYPDGRLLNEQGLELPVLPELAVRLLPSELLSRSPHLQQSWLDLLAADAALAAANRERFPRLSFTADVDQNVDWNLMASLTQPLFNAGKLAAAEDQAAARVRQSEKTYLRDLFAVFADVENALMQETTLKRRYQLALQSEQSAREQVARVLSEYQLGLSPMDTLLSAQKAMLDAQAQRIELQFQQLENRVTLYRLMGGDFSAGADSDAPDLRQSL